MENQSNQKKPKKSKYPGIEKYGKFSGMAFQMIAIILVFVWGGLDDKFHAESPLFIIIFAILGVFIALFVSLRDFIKF